MPGQNCSAPAPVIDWAQPKGGWAMPQAMNSDLVQNRWLNCVWARSMEPPDAARWREGYSARGLTEPRHGAERVLSHARVRRALLGVLPKHERCSPLYPVQKWAGASSPRPHRGKVGWNNLEVLHSCRPEACALLGCFRPTSCCVRGDLPRSGESAKAHYFQLPNGWACVRDQR